MKLHQQTNNKESERKVNNGFIDSIFLNVKKVETFVIEVLAFQSFKYPLKFNFAFLWILNYSYDFMTFETFTKLVTFKGLLNNDRDLKNFSQKFINFSVLILPVGEF